MNGCPIECLYDEAASVGFLARSRMSELLIFASV
jgi:hypothetical protein